MRTLLDVGRTLEPGPRRGHPAARGRSPPTADPASARAACTVASARAQDSRPPCCFTNRAFVGGLLGQPGEKESCASILEYLNDPQSQGKAYCSHTTIRGRLGAGRLRTKTGR